MKKTILIMTICCFLYSVANVGASGFITYSFDDGDTNTYNIAYPILAAHGQIGTVNPVLDRVLSGTYSSMNVQQLLDLQAAGWEICSHSVIHVNMEYLPLTYEDETSGSSNSAERELEMSKVGFNDLGLNVQNFVVPGSRWNDDLAAIAARYYNSAATGGGSANTLPLANQWAIKRRCVGSEYSVSDITAWINNAVNNDEWLILMFHNICESETCGYAPWAESKLDALATWVENQGITVVTQQQGLELSNTPINDNFACGALIDTYFLRDTLNNGMEYYTDRNYTLTSVPSAYIGMDAILTPNDDRNDTDATDYLTFTMPDNGMVYVAYDARATALPTWMSGFSRTGDRIYTSLSTQPYLNVYSRSYNAGECVNLGANKGKGFSGNTVSNFIVFYGDGANLPSPTCILDYDFEQTTLAVNMEYYTDRNYTLTSVPSGYIGMDAILTPNDERNDTDATDYLTFTMPDNGMVYVAYDARATALPAWMSGFSRTGDRIYTSLSTQPYLNVYSRSYNAGECVNFGANKGKGFSGNTVSNFMVFYSDGANLPSPTCILDYDFEQTTLLQRIWNTTQIAIIR